MKRWAVARSDEAFAAALDEHALIMRHSFWVTGQEGGGQESGNSAAKVPDRACLRLKLAEALLHCRRSCVGRKMPVGNTGERCGGDAWKSRQDNDQHSFLRKPCKAYRPEEAEDEMKRGGAHASAPPLSHRFLHWPVKCGIECGCASPWPTHARWGVAHRGSAAE